MVRCRSPAAHPASMWRTSTDRSHPPSVRHEIRYFFACCEVAQSWVSVLLRESRVPFQPCVVKGRDSVNPWACHLLATRDKISFSLRASNTVVDKAYFRVDIWFASSRLVTEMRYELLSVVHEAKTWFKQNYDR